MRNRTPTFLLCAVYVNQELTVWPRPARWLWDYSLDQMHVAVPLRRPPSRTSPCSRPHSPPAPVSCAAVASPMLWTAPAAPVVVAMAEIPGLSRRDELPQRAHGISPVATIA
jgi:hypothetical protein